MGYIFCKPWMKKSLFYSVVLNEKYSTSHYTSLHLTPPSHTRISTPGFISFPNCHSELDPQMPLVQCHRLHKKQRHYTWCSQDCTSSLWQILCSTWTGTERGLQKTGEEQERLPQYFVILLTHAKKSPFHSTFIYSYWHCLLWANILDNYLYLLFT